MTHCKMAFDHQPSSTCEHCNLPTDAYGNTEYDFHHCSFPDCGCDGARLCMAGQASENAQTCNVEGMWQRTDKEALSARKLLVLALRIDIDIQQRLPPCSPS